MKANYQILLDGTEYVKDERLGREKVAIRKSPSWGFLLIISIYIKRESLSVTSRPIAQLSVGQFG